MAFIARTLSPPPLPSTRTSSSLVNRVMGSAYSTKWIGTRWDIHRVWLHFHLYTTASEKGTPGQFSARFVGLCQKVGGANCCQGLEGLRRNFVGMLNHQHQMLVFLKCVVFSATWFTVCKDMCTSLDTSLCARASCVLASPYFWITVSHWPEKPLKLPAHTF